MGTPIATLQTQVGRIAADSWTPLAESMVTALNYYQRADTSAPDQGVLPEVVHRHRHRRLSDQGPERPRLPAGRQRRRQGPRDVHQPRGPVPEQLQLLALPGRRGGLPVPERPARRPGRHPERGDVRDRLQPQRAHPAAHRGRGRRRVLQREQPRGAWRSRSSEAFIAIEARISAGSAVSVVSAEDRTNNRLYRARYESQTWRGFVEAFNLPYHAGDARSGRRAACWSAAIPARGPSSPRRPGPVSSR